MKKIGQFLFTLKEYFINEEDRKSIEKYRKGTIFVYSMLLIAVLSILMVFAVFLDGNEIGQVFSLFMPTVLFVILFLYKKKGKRVLFVNITVFLYLLPTYIVNLMQGGIYSPSSYFNIAVCSFAFVLANKKSGLIWFFLVITTFMLFSLLDYFGYYVFKNTIGQIGFFYYPMNFIFTASSMLAMILLYEKNKETHINELEGVKFELEKKNKTIELSYLEIAESKQYLADVKRQNALETEILYARLKALNAQINPHFIFNSLTTVQKYLYQNDIDSSLKYVGHFAKLMRTTLENSEKAFVSIKDELSAIEHYVNFESMRIRNEVELKVNISENIDIEKLLIPTLIIQPFVENSILHGLNDKNDSCWIKIEISKVDSYLKCIIEDNVIGRSKAEINKTHLQIVNKSMGTKITERRLALLSQSKDVDLNIEYVDLFENGNPIGTRVIIKLPFVQVAVAS